MLQTLPFDSLSTLLKSEQRILAAYLPGSNRSAWNAVSELARAGAQVTILGPSAECSEFLAGLPGTAVHSLPDLSQGLPAGCNLFVVSEGAGLHKLLALALANVRPAVIVTSDADQTAADRRDKYALLTEKTYYFAGIEAGHSIWTNLKRAPAQDRGVLLSLPAELAALPIEGAGSVYLDREMAPPGQVLEIMVRAALEISGWAVIAAGAPPASHLFACVQNERTGVREFLPLHKEPRPDVTTHFGNAALLMSGFRVDLSPLCRRLGIHIVTVIQSDGIGLYQSLPLFRFAMVSQEFELAARNGLAQRYLFGSGIEIGALQKPLKVSDSCQVRYIDRMTLPKLLEHYPEMAQYPLQAPDIVDDGQQLSHIAENSQDFIVANHFLEHCPDPILSIHTMLRVVRPGGILFMAVPDKRHTFDFCRPVTPYASLKNAYLTGQRSGTAELFYEWAHFVTGLPGEQAQHLADQLLAEDYSIHYNVWAATDLFSFLLTARHDFQIPFELIAAVSSENETIVILERTGGRLPA
jgi:SAM-dependent methyltransferase